MKRLALVGVLFLFSGGVAIKGSKHATVAPNSESRLLDSSDKLEAATRKLEDSSRKLKIRNP